MTRTKRTYVDANVLIAGFRGDDASGASALRVLGDAERVFVASDFLRLEVQPKPGFHGRRSELAFYSAFFDAVAEWVTPSPALTAQAIALATRYDLTPLDALHVAAATIAAVDELVTLEKATKPMLRVSEIPEVSLYR